MALTLRFVRAWPAALAATLLAAVPGTPRAQPVESPAASAGEPTDAELAAARELFKEGLALEKKGQWEQALGLFDKVANVKLTPQVRYHRALCHEKLGRLVEALNGFELALHEAKNLGSTAADVTENAPPHIAALREQVGFVRLHAAGKVRTSRILLDGKPVLAALLDTDIPLDPGPHVVEVERGGTIASRHELQIEKQTTAELALPIDDPEQTPATATTAPTGPAAPAEPGDSSLAQLPAYLVGGAGLVMVGLGGLFWGLRESTISDVQAGCHDPENYRGCDPDLQATADQGETYTLLSRIFWPVGGAALATGIVLWFVLDPAEGSDGTASTSALRVAPTPGGLQLSGRF